MTKTPFTLWQAGVPADVWRSLLPPSRRPFCHAPSPDRHLASETLRLARQTSPPTAPPIIAVTQERVLFKRWWRRPGFFFLFRGGFTDVRGVPTRERAKTRWICFGVERKRGIALRPDIWRAPPLPPPSLPPSEYEWRREITVRFLHARYLFSFHSVSTQPPRFSLSDLANAQSEGGSGWIQLPSASAPDAWRKRNRHVLAG